MEGVNEKEKGAKMTPSGVANLRTGTQTLKVEL